MSTKTIKCDFASYESKFITKGEKLALEGWWKAANECRKYFTKGNGAPNKAAYAKFIEENNIASDNTEDTIRQYVGKVITAQDMGYVMSDFKGIDHLRKTLAGAGQRKVEPKKVVRNAEAKAYEAMMATKEFKALPARARKAMALLAKGEAFSTVSL